VKIDSGGYVEHDEKRFAAETTMNLRLSTFDGAIEVRGWDKPEIVVLIEKRAQDKASVSKIQVNIEQKDDSIQIEAHNPDKRGVFVGFGSFTSPSAKLIVNAPRKTNLVLRTDDGSLLVERVTGRIELRTGDGGIRTIETDGDLLAETRDGTIQLDEVAGRIEARTDDGSLRITGMPVVIRARTNDGSVVLRIRRGTTMAEDWMVTTGDGSISAELPDSLNADIEADPGSDGRARSDLTLVGLTGGTREQRLLRGRLGQGGHRFLLRTGDGTIRLTPY
jgi:hypothetical protein